MAEIYLVPVEIENFEIDSEYAVQGLFKVLEATCEAFADEYDKPVLFVWEIK